jgi:hypothetical protein
MTPATLPEEVVALFLTGDVTAGEDVVVSGVGVILEKDFRVMCSTN